jgi:hypothetical protein
MLAQRTERGRMPHRLKWIGRTDEMGTAQADCADGKRFIAKERLRRQGCGPCHGHDEE